MDLPAEFELRSPSSEADFEKYYRLRFETLRKPWNQPPGSERDAGDQDAVHALILHSEKAVAVGRLHMNSTEQAQIRYMGVDEKYRNKGLGAAVISFLETKAKELGAKTMMLESRDNAVPFYRKQGYVIDKKSYVLFDTIQHYTMIKKV